MKIFYDMDNTIAEMSRALGGIYSGRQKDYYTFKEMTRKEIVSRLHEKDFFLNLTIIQNSQSVMRKLVKNGEDVYILSQPMINDYCIEEKNIWLNRFFPFIPAHKRFFTFDKFLLSNKGRLLIDDNIEHLTHWEKEGGIGICFQRGYNKQWQGTSIKYHKEIFDIIDKLRNPSF